MGDFGMVVKARKRPTGAGRFVTLRSGRVIFLPKGKRTKWADVRDKIKAGKKGDARAGEATTRVLSDGEYSWEAWSPIKEDWEGQLADLRRGDLSAEQREDLKNVSQIMYAVQSDWGSGGISTAIMSRSERGVEGMGSFRMESEGTQYAHCIVNQLATAPRNQQFSGERRAGYGTRIMKEMARAALERGAKKMSLDAASEGAAVFYKKLGFEQRSKADPRRMEMDEEGIRRLSDAEVR